MTKNTTANLCDHWTWELGTEADSRGFDGGEFGGDHDYGHNPYEPCLECEACLAVLRENCTDEYAPY